MNQQDNNKSRREFMKQGTILAGGVLTAPLFANANYFSGADAVIRVALIGCGDRGTGAAMQALLTKQNVKLVAMADAFRDRIDNSFKNLNVDDLSDWSGVKGNVKNKLDVPEERKFVGFDAYLKAIPLADVIILTTPPGFRPIHFEEAVKQGKHVFMEKPVATDPNGVMRVLNAAEEAKKKKLNVVVGLQRHYQNSYKELFKRKDQIGEIVS
ncbi:MAG: dehydrogenase, partial [Sphingobacteriales bacterium]